MCIGFFLSNMIFSPVLNGSKIRPPPIYFIKMQKNSTSRACHSEYSVNIFYQKRDNRNKRYRLDGWKCGFWTGRFIILYSIMYIKEESARIPRNGPEFMSSSSKFLKWVKAVHTSASKTALNDYSHLTINLQGHTHLMGIIVSILGCQEDIISAS